MGVIRLQALFGREGRSSCSEPEDLRVVVAKGVGLLERRPESVEVIGGQTGAERLQAFHRVDQDRRIAVAGEFSERADVVRPEDGRHQDLRLTGGGENGVEDYPRNPSVAIGEGVDLADGEHEEDGSGKWGS